MTIEEKKQLLRKYSEIEERIEQLRRSKEKCRVCDEYQSPEFEEKIKGSKDRGSVVEVTVEKREIDWDALIEKELEQLYDIRISIEKAINSLTDLTQQRLLRLLYLGEIDEFGDRSKFSFAEISKILCYSERQIFRIYKKALINLPDIFYDVSECQ